MKQITNVVLADVTLDRSGRASGTQSTSRPVGSALGIAVLGTLLFTSLAPHLTAPPRRSIPGRRAHIVDAVTGSAGAAIPRLQDDPVTAAIGRAPGGGVEIPGSVGAERQGQQGQQGHAAAAAGGLRSAEGSGAVENFRSTGGASPRLPA